jgi:hypothetical protein
MSYFAFYLFLLAYLVRPLGACLKMSFGRARKPRVFRGFTHFGPAEDPVITIDAEIKPEENQAASWVFLVTVL